MFTPFARSRVLALALVLLASTAAHAATSVIVELTQEPAAMAVARARSKGTPMTAAQIESYRSTLAAAQQQFLGKLASSGIAYQVGGTSVNNVRVDFRYTLVFNGINLLVDPAAIARIQAMPEVKAVHADKVMRTLLDVSVPYIRAPQVYGAIKELTRFDTAREGFEGQGINISIIDSGVEWHHEMFGGDPTPPRLGVAPATASGTNEKLVYYLPLADLVVEDGLGHGTHVASTAAGYQGFTPGPDGIPLNADDVKIHGVAPQARIMSYKVCSDAVSIPGALTGAVGGCLTSVITMGIEDSVSPRTVNGFPKPVAHVINMSLGGSGGPDDVTSVASDNAVRMGTIVVAAAGNSGPGESTVGAPCAGRLVTCVANSIDPAGSWSFDVLAPSSVNRLLPGAVKPASSLAVASNQRRGVQLVPMAGTAEPIGSVAQYYVYVAGGETPAAYPASVSGRIAIVGAGTLPATFAQIVNSAAASGAVGVILRSATANPTAVKASIPGANLIPADFDYLVSIMNAGTTPPNGTLSTYPVRINPFFGSTTMNSSSSRGPVEGFGQIKPDVTAPGTNITAAMPPASLLGVLAQGNYGAISGTSMASPHVAGASALVKQAHLTWSPDWVRTALMNTATNLRNELGANKPDSNTAEQVNDQGAGLIDVNAAVNIKALMGVQSDDPLMPSLLGSHSFGEVPAINAHAVITRSVPVSLLDVSGTWGTYALTVVNNRGLELPGISAWVMPSNVTLGPNSQAIINVAVSIDGSVVTSGDPLQLQWYVRATRNDGSGSLAMPFYLRAIRLLPSAASLNPIGDDATPDRENGIDRDGRFAVSWSYPATEAAQPCGYRIEETRPTASGTIWLDAADELMLNAGNSIWDATDWTTRPHPNTLSTGYAPIYIDNSTASMTTKNDIQLPQALIHLTFESFEDLELDFDYGHFDVSTDHGATWDEVTSYTGAFSGTRSINLSAYAGKAVRLRFRIAADSLISTPAYQGWYVDDIRIQAGSAFNTIATVPSSSTSLAIGGKQDGTYAYRVVALFDNCAMNPFATTPSGIEEVTVQISTRPPMAAFSSSANPSQSAQSVTFDASASADQDQVGSSPGIAQYYWSFGDGGTATGSVASHAYATPGTYRVALTVVDEEGESASTEELQTVHDADSAVYGGGSVSSTNFGVDAGTLAGTPDGSMTWNDPVARMSCESTRIARVDRNGNRATIYGDCVLNKRQTLPFVMEVVDNGASDDTASMRIGSYSSSGTVTGGNVTVQ